MYKIIKDNKVIDVIQHPTFVRFLSSGCIAFTDKTSAHGVIGSDDKTIYSFKQFTGKKYPIVSIVEIKSEQEFSRLQSLLNSDKKVSADESALVRAKQDTLKYLSAICKNTITAGFSVTLSDGKKHSFRLTIEDQLNLMNLENQFNTGAKTFVYHATDMPCRVFTREDMSIILGAFRRYTQYHTTYFNVAKQYINSLTDIEVVESFTYGTDVSDTSSDPTIRQILKRGGTIG
jgi:hypothetical protein